MGLVLALICAAYAVLLSTPKLLFKVSHQAGDLTIYSNTEPDIRLKDLAGRAQARSAESVPLANGNFEVFLVGDAGKFNLLSPLWRNAFSSYNPLTGKILIALPDLEKLQAAHPGGNEPPRSLEGLMVHELVKARLKVKLNFLTYVMLPELKVEGFAETVAMETGGMVPADMCPSKDNGSTLTKYLRYRLILEHLAFENDMTRIDLLKSNKGDEAGIRRAMSKHCGTN